MKISEEFAGGLMKAADLGRDAVTYTINDVKLQQFKDDEPKKCVLSFDETSSELALNNTNRKMLVELLGDDTDDWIGRQITLYKGKVSYQGNMVDSIKIDDRPQQAASAARPAARPAPANRAPATPARRAANAQRTQTVQELAGAAGGEEEDDGDPFSDDDENATFGAEGRLMEVPQTNTAHA